MKHEQKLELDILSKLKETGKISIVEFSKLFPDWADYETTFTRLQGKGGSFLESYVNDMGTYTYFYELNNHGKVKLKGLLLEKSEEGEFKKWQSKQSSESSSVNTGTKILVVIGFVTLGIVIATLYYTCNPYHSDSSPSNKSAQVDTIAPIISSEEVQKLKDNFNDSMMNIEIIKDSIARDSVKKLPGKHLLRPPKVTVAH